MVRHGQSEANVLRDAAEAAGDLTVRVTVRDADVALSDLGHEQAGAVGRWLAENPAWREPTRLLVSPYLRTRQTASLLLEAAGRPMSALSPEPDERLRDREMGQLQWLTWRGIEERWPGEARRALELGHYYYRPPGGESWADICLRLRALFADLARAHREDRVLVVTHDVIIQLTRALLEGLDEEQTVRLIASTPYANCALAAFERDSSGYKVTAYNETAPVREQGSTVTKETDAARTVS